jgi:nucleoside-diphosphate-sugar epimerase
VDRDAEDPEGAFGAHIASLRPDVVIDLVCFTAASARQLVDALRPSRPLLLHCGTIWVHGPALRVPVTEDEPRTAYGEYGTGKAEIESLLHRETMAGGVPAVVLHPGHISGPGWPVITPAEATREHTFRSITASVSRAREVLGHAPRYSSLDALHEALTWLVAHGQVDVGDQRFPAPSLDFREPAR